jgi:hypothetical protein
MVENNNYRELIRSGKWRELTLEQQREILIIYTAEQWRRYDDNLVTAELKFLQRYGLQFNGVIEPW